MMINIMVWYHTLWRDGESLQEIYTPALTRLHGLSVIAGNPV